MPLAVTRFASYLTRTTREWSDRDFSAMMFIKAIKQTAFNGYGHVPFPDGVSRRISAANMHEAPGWFGELAADYTRTRANPAARWSLVPFPSREAVRNGQPSKYVSLGLARCVAASMGGLGYNVVVADVVRWSQRRPSAHDENGSRVPEGVYPYLTMLPGLEPTRHVILIDDVATSGARLRSAAALLRNSLAAGAVVWKALVAGQTVHEQPDDPFAVTEWTLDDYHP